MKIIGIHGEAGSNKMIYAFRLIRDLNLLGHRTVWGNFAESLYLELNKIASERVKGDSLGTIVESNDLAVNGSYDAAEALYKMLDPSLIGESNPEYGYSRRNEYFRKSMDIFATQIRREQDPEYFIKKTETKYENTTDVIISTDLRFQNEIDHIHSKGGVVIGVDIFFQEEVDKALNSSDFKYSSAGKSLASEKGITDYNTFDYFFTREYFDSQSLSLLLEKRLKLEPKENNYGWISY